ncbi:MULTISPECIES: DUF4386 domain-containing protein [Cryobacterium]|uniref:DUF4386 domain-containing protein n=1 Tax=Cryobacterium TaxID=69578 RepID=UPI000CD45958|nr:MULTISPECIES: DUF4386 domain-containing protein [Cryobacterium]POH63670.1 DUF4386 domain-containing protein [Cryobacterium zongtaii]TFC40801.1 DUF4386 domain-containing protein [Cryobacterium sp. TMN-39-2]
MSPIRRTAILAGVLFLLTEVGAIVGRLLYAPVLNTPGYVLGTGRDPMVAVGVLFEVVLVIAVVGTGVVLYPVLRRQSPTLALAYAAARILEAAIILVGTLSLLTVLMLRQQPPSVDASALEAVAAALLALQDGTLLFGPGFALGIGSILLASLIFTSRLVPRAIAVLGLVGGAIITISTVLVIFGLYGQFSPSGLLVALPVFAWEVSLALWLILKGFNTAAVERMPQRRVGADPVGVTS